MGYSSHGFEGGGVFTVLNVARRRISRLRVRGGGVRGRRHGGEAAGHLREGARVVLLESGKGARGRVMLRLGMDLSAMGEILQRDEGVFLGKSRFAVASGVGKGDRPPGFESPATRGLCSLCGRRRRTTPSGRCRLTLSGLRRSGEGVFVRKITNSNGDALVGRCLDDLSGSRQGAILLVTPANGTTSVVNNVAVRGTFRLPDSMRFPSRVAAIPGTLRGVGAVVVSRVDVIHVSMFRGVVRVLGCMGRAANGTVELVMINSFKRLQPILASRSGTVFGRFCPRVGDCCTFSTPR